jgi:hypothetical protein
MKLSFVKLVSSSYDPRTDKRSPLHGVTDFDSAAGYEMELRDGYVTIAHSGRKALYSLGRVDFSLVAEEQPSATIPTGLLYGLAACPHPPWQLRADSGGTVCCRCATRWGDGTRGADVVTLVNPADAVHFDLTVQSIPDEPPADAPAPATATVTHVDKDAGVMVVEATPTPAKKKRRR